MLDLIVATKNQHKVRELTTLLKVAGIRWRSLAEYPDVRSIKETGRTFDANAIKKARAVARVTGLFALADDSGIEVDALRGGPGVRSARFAGAHGNDAANNRKLLAALKGRSVAQRRAAYRCSLALASPSRLLALTRGQWVGRIAHQPAGAGGFGYDPIFLVPRFGKTVGQLPATVKQRLSHRAQAARKMRVVLQRFVTDARRRRGYAAGRRGRARVA